MWELWEISIVPDDYTCGKCTQLQLLGDRFRELELELDTLRIIRDAEHIIDKSFSEVVTPKMQAESSLVITKKGKGTGDDRLGESTSSQISGTMTGSGAQLERVKVNRTLVIGDSIIRGTDRRFCGRRRKSRM
eukprot:g46972.t1